LEAIGNPYQSGVGAVDEATHNLADGVALLRTGASIQENVDTMAQANRL